MSLRASLPGPLALVLLTVAVVGALGGTSYAAARLAANSVGTVQLKDQAVTSRKIENRTIRRADLSRAVAKRDVVEFEVVTDDYVNDAVVVPGLVSLSFDCSVGYAQLRDLDPTPDALMGTGVETTDGRATAVGYSGRESIGIAAWGTMSVSLALASKGSGPVADLSLHMVKTGSSCRYFGQVVR